MKYGFIKVACCSPCLTVADCEFNGKNIINEAETLAEAGVEIAVFPELSITGCSCGDLFFQRSLQIGAVKELEVIAQATSGFNMIIFVGLPFVQPDGIFNVAAVLYKGDVLALIPKTNVGVNPDGSGIRVFSSGAFSMKTRFVSIGHFYDVPFGTNIIITPSDKSFTSDNSYGSGFALACEIGGDLLSPFSPSVCHSVAGASIIVNPFSFNEEIGRGDFLRTAIKAKSSCNICGYVAAGAGWYESTQDAVYGGRKFIAENGNIIGEGNVFGDASLVSDIDIELIVQERMKKGLGRYGDMVSNEYVSVKADFDFLNNDKGEGAGCSVFKEKLSRKITSQPFFTDEGPAAEEKLCGDVAELQARGLARRLMHIHCKSAVIGLSGGLDSTLALLVTCRAFDICQLPRAGITAVTMPCFGTTDRTYNNACRLAREWGVTLVEVPIASSVIQHFKDIGHDESCHDVTYENSQARERTQVLMDYANKVNGIVIGTGDLSELALGWCTYNGDHMSMYGVNSSVPKTLVRHIVRWFADSNKSDVLKDILDTPVSPELLPPSQGNISQVTEDLVGPYELHDFYLYYILRYGFEPEKILYLAENSPLAQVYTREIMVKWLKTFYRRFFSQQFKRSCMPDGVKAGNISLSPRGDWKMPSDSSGALWIKEVEKL